MNFIREDIPSKLLNDDTFVSGIENLLVEIKLRFKNGLFRFFQPTFKFSLISIQFDLYSSKYESFIVLGGFNTEITKTHTEKFCSVYNFKNLIKDPICFKNPKKPTLIDHILTNHPRCYLSILVFIIQAYLTFTDSH